ncbi:oligosaccharide flippase family protein [Halomicrobium mukohataei]|uniref:Oligosaccharide flippase family protein n=1 Tax=Halomicrobium mukohataei TaxID=57705 RepID=A0A847U765_9EURY|nr:flippase [Halomicrobium mukohataei]NLV11583.1 oligosaccharide flippase family protein [Halomicrobium mukohataei]
MNIARSTIKIFVSKAFTSVFGFLGLVIFARELGSYELGVFFLFQAILGMLAVPADFGLNVGVVKKLSEGQTDPSTVVTTAMSLKTIPLFILSVTILILRDYINTYIGGELALLLIIALVIQEFSKFFIQVLKGELRVGSSALPQLSRQVIFVLTSVCLLRYTNLDVIGLVIGLIVGIIFKLFWSFHKSTISLGYPSRQCAISLYSYSKYVLISKTGRYFFNWMDIVIIGVILSQSEVGVYEVSWRVTSLILVFTSAISTTIFPQLSEWHAEDALDRIETIIPESLAAVSFITIPAFFGVLALSSDILHIIFGTEYVEGSLVLTILIGGKIFQSFQDILARTLEGIDFPKQAAISNLCSISVNLILNIILIYKFGIIGAAFATISSYIVNLLILYYCLTNKVKLGMPSHRILVFVCSSLVMYFMLFQIKAKIEIQTPIILSSVIIFGAGIYFATTLLFPSTRRMILDYLDQLGISG